MSIPRQSDDLEEGPKWRFQVGSEKCKDLSSNLRLIYKVKGEQLKRTHHNNYIRGWHIFRRLHSRFRKESPKASETLLPIRKPDDPIPGFKACNGVNYKQSPWIYQTDIDEIQCRVLMKRDIHRGCFQTVSGLNKDVPPGFAFYQMKNSNTNEEKVAIRNEWRHCIDESDFLSPASMYLWFVDGMAQALKMLQDEDEEMAQIEMFVTFPMVTLKVYDIPPPVDGAQPNDFTDCLPSCTINIFPAIMGTGWPEGVSLHHALPNLNPYLKLGQRCIAEIKEEMADGQPMWFLEARPLTGTTKLEGVKLFSRVLKDLDRSSRLWKFSFTTVMTRLFQNIEEVNELGYCDDVLYIMQAIRRNLNDSAASVLRFDILKTIMLIEHKRQAAKLRTPGDIFIVVLTKLRDMVKSATCPHYLLRNINIFDTVNSQSLQEAFSPIQQMLKDITKRPYKVLKYAGSVKHAIPEVHELRDQTPEPV
ncbi:unnamed protein product [Owenia fusiformis]|uniref:Uncharacterized protein n=1 Tax=Owenia fusiformis TaxID=6347 RepID=A0A8J1XVY6_OWEFU|nr:unnamed protein product [Owenia fusiformis]